MEEMEPTSPRPRTTLEDQLREVMHPGEASFDYGALVAGVHQRAGRIRRRRAITQAAVAAVLVPGLVGGAVLLSQQATDDDRVVVGPARTGQTDAPLRTGERDAPASTTPAPAPTDSVEPTDGVETTGDEATGTESVEPEPEPTDPPHQQTAPPTVPDSAQGQDPQSAWTVPDPRPSGVAFLDDLGAPRLHLTGPRTIPLAQYMLGNDFGLEGGREPVAAATWGYYTDRGLNGPTVDIVVTGWEDGQAAMDDLRANRLAAQFDPPLEPVAWVGHEGDDDYLLLPGPDRTGTGRQRGGAVVRVGDYLVGVTVESQEGDVRAVAAEIADKTAQNLAVLDPERGRD